MGVSVNDSKKILIVDDEADLLVLLQKRLSKAGFRCMGCATVEAGLKWLANYHPDLVILDLGFRKASGFAFLQNMKDHLSGKGRPPVMVLSAYGDPEVVAHARALGVQSFMTKPFDASTFLKEVGGLVQ